MPLSLRDVLRPKNFFFTDRQIWALMLPLMAEGLLSIAVGLADSMMVSRVGQAAISAVSLVDSVSVLMVFIFSAAATGGAAVAGQYLGRGEPDRARRACQQLLVLLAATSLACTGLLYALKPVVLHTLFGRIDADVMAATDKYYTIVMAAVPGIALYNGGAAIFRAMRRADVTLKVSLVMNLVNVAGNALLIFGLKMDVAGVAVPTLVSRWLAAGIILPMLLDRRRLLFLPDFRGFRFDPGILRNILGIGIPGGIENGMFQFGKIILYSLISTMGTDAISANAIAGTLTVLHCFAGVAINHGIVPIVSQCVGAGDFDQARFYIRKITRQSYAVMAAVNVLFIVLLRPILSIYDIPPECEEIAYKSVLLHGICSIFIWLPGFQIPAYLRAAGDAAYAMVVSVATMWVCRVGGAFLLGKYMGLGVFGVWIAHSVLDWIARGALNIHRYRGGKWMEKRIRD